MSNVKAINTYLANLAVWNVKLHNLHWNVKGQFFMPIHNYTEKLYNEVFEAYDDVAEVLKMRGELPLASMKAYLEAATIKEIETRVISCCEVHDILVNDIEHMMKAAMAILEEAAKEDDFQVQAMFEEYINAFRKELWMLRAMKKDEGCSL